MLVRGHPEYPDAWANRDTQQVPMPVYARGRVPVSPAVTLVGTRTASPMSLRFTRALAFDLAARGIVIWSGGAIGIDTAAHLGALDAGGSTVVVLAGGLDRAYPPENRPLFERVLAAGGALVSLQPDLAPSRPAYFIQRNALLAVVGEVTVVVQAGVKSGARSTAAAARRAGRPVAVVPQAPWDSRGAGCVAELMLGATPVARAADVWRILSERVLLPPFDGEDRSRGVAAKVRTVCPSLRGEVEEALWVHLADDPSHVDELCERADLPAHRVLPALLTMALRAVVVEGPAGCYRRA